MPQIRILKNASPAVAKELSVLMQQLSGKNVSLGLLRASIRNPNTTVFILTDTGRIIGTATLTFSQTLTGLRAYVDHVVVDDAYRGKGLGGFLMDKVMAFARRKKVKKMALTSRADRVAAHKLYEKLGFVRRDTNYYEMKF